MEFDFPVENFKTPPHPKGITLVGENVRLEPLNVQNHSANLHEANSLDVEGNIKARDKITKLRQTFIKSNNY